MYDTVNGYGGVIAIDRKGNLGKAFNTEKMVWACVKANTLQYGIEPEEVITEQLQKQ